VKSLLVILNLFILPAAFADRPQFTEETCENRDAVTKEVIELELSGDRWQGGDSDCLKQENFKTVVAAKQELGNPDLLDPTYLATGEVRIIKQKWLDDVGAVEVEFAYIGQKISPGGSRTPANVTDTLVYKVNLGKRREQEGCASLLDAPKNFVMKKSCHHE
jgi:hypothetical protein